MRNMRKNATPVSSNINHTATTSNEDFQKYYKESKIKKKIKKINKIKTEIIKVKTKHRYAQNFDGNVMFLNM